MSQLNPICASLLKGFLHEWNEHEMMIDTYTSKLTLCESAAWCKVVMASLQAAGTYYSDSIYKLLHDGVMATKNPIYFQFYYCQLAQITKYMRRGIVFPELVKHHVLHAWIGMEFINRLPM